jgi:hypothetical protein
MDANLEAAGEADALRESVEASQGEDGSSSREDLVSPENPNLERSQVVPFFYHHKKILLFFLLNTSSAFLLNFVHLSDGFENFQEIQEMIPPGMVLKFL